MSDKWIKVFAPASVANLGPGFDVLGLALENPGDIVEVCLSDNIGVEIVEISGDNKKLSLSPLENTASGAAIKVLTKLKAKQGIRMRIHKKMAIGTGIGSSAASSAASVWATNLAFGSPFTKYELLDAALEGERIADGAWHGDNVFPSLLGGMILIKEYNPLEIMCLPIPENLIIVIALPDIEVQTKYARSVLPSKVFLKDAIHNWGNLATMITAIYSDDLELFGRAIDDAIIEPARAHLIPGFYDIKKAAITAGAYGCSISGAGPAVFAITDSKKKGEFIGQAMKEAFLRNEFTSSVIVSGVNKTGAQELPE